MLTKLMVLLHFLTGIIFLSDYKYCYFLESGELLSSMNLPIDAIQCKNIKCNSINHFKDFFYNIIIESLLTAACNTIPVGDNLVLEKLPPVITVSYQVGMAQ